MIDEKDLAKLSYANAPSISSENFPGPKSQESLTETFECESMARGGGRFPFVFSEGKGATVKDPDGNIMIDITAGVAVNSVGRCHPRVIEAMQKQMGTLMHASDIFQRQTNRTCQKGVHRSSSRATEQLYQLLYPRRQRSR